MKLRQKATGEIWDVCFIVATNPATGEDRHFHNGYELIQDEPPKPGAHARIDELLKRVESLESERKGVADVILSHGAELEEGLKFDTDILERVRALESDNHRLKERINTIEGVCIQR